MNTSPNIVASVELRRHKYFLSWIDFHKKNRDIMQEICAVMDTLIQSRVKKFSVKEIIMHLRFSAKLHGTKKTNIYFNDAYIAIYAHIIADTYPRKYGRYISKRPLPASK